MPDVLCRIPEESVKTQIHSNTHTHTHTHKQTHTHTDTQTHAHHTHKHIWLAISNKQHNPRIDFDMQMFTDGYSSLQSIKNYFDNIRFSCLYHFVPSCSVSYYIQGLYMFFTSKFKDFSQTFQRPKSDLQIPVLLISSSKINLKV